MRGETLRDSKGGKWCVDLIDGLYFLFFFFFFKLLKEA